MLADGTVFHHTHGAHGHQHSHTQTKAVLNRMARLIGHLESIKHMIEDGRDCSEVLVQLSAVDSAIKGVSRIILTDHLEHCIVDAVRDNDQEALHQLNWLTASSSSARGFVSQSLLHFCESQSILVLYPIGTMSVYHFYNMSGARALHR